MAALLGLVGLLGLAVGAPLLASNKPFYWQVDGEGARSPWLEAMFDRTFYESSVDVFFNVVFCVGALSLVPLILLWRRSATLPRRARGRRRLWLLAGWFGLVAVVDGAIESNPIQTPKVVFPALEAELKAEGHEVVAVYPPLAASYRDDAGVGTRAPPSLQHPLGTDGSGRDVAVRLLYGTRISLTVGIFAVGIYVTIGTFLGSLAGYFGGKVDAVILRIIEVVICVPSIFLILAAAAFIEDRSIFHIMLLIAAVAWTTPARLVRAEFLRLRNLDFVHAARAVGYSELQIIFREVLPNALSPLLVYATFGVARAILVESTMSFLGLGDITVPSWGQVLNNGRTSGEWIMILSPGFAIFLTVSLLNLLGEGLRDALDPKLRA
jgi:peptide/nickel transport system permease protein